MSFNYIVEHHNHLKNRGMRWEEHSLRDLWDSIKRTKYMHAIPEEERMRYKQYSKKLWLKFSS